MTKKLKLELTWIGKDVRPKLEPRILMEDPSKSYHAKHRVTDKDIFNNRLIFGDNLLGLKALEGEFSGKVRCIFIDPPYNTGSAFTHYDGSSSGWFRSSDSSCARMTPNLSPPRRSDPVKNARSHSQIGKDQILGYWRPLHVLGAGSASAADGAGLRTPRRNSQHPETNACLRGKAPSARMW